MEKFKSVFNKLYLTFNIIIFSTFSTGSAYWTVCTLHDSYISYIALNKAKQTFPNLGVNSNGNTYSEISYLEGFLEANYCSNNLIKKFPKEFEVRCEYYEYASKKYNAYIHLKNRWGDYDSTNFWSGIGIAIGTFLSGCLIIGFSIILKKWLKWLVK